MEYQNEVQMHQENYTPVPAPSEPKQSPNSMATASLVMGILAVVTGCCYYTGFIFGGLGILFALLSRTEEKMRGQAITGLTLSIVGAVLSVVFWGAILFTGLQGGIGGSRPIQNLPAVPDFTRPALDNILTILRQLPMGGGI